jgi:hypothetical protein
MLPTVLKLKRNTLHLQTREVICSVMAFMEDEGRNKPSTPIEKAQLWTAKATGVSRTAVKETKREANRLSVAQGTPYLTPDNKLQKTLKH